MEKRICKTELTTSTLTELKKGDKLIIACDSYNAYNSAATLVRLFNRRKEEHLKEQGIDCIVAEKDKASNDIVVKVI